MFQLALRTAMRLREIYTLQIRIADKTIYLSKSKNGDRRQVPLNSKARAVLEAPWPALEATRRCGQLIPLWDGQLEPKALGDDSHAVAAVRLLDSLVRRVSDVTVVVPCSDPGCRWQSKLPLAWPRYTPLTYILLWRRIPNVHHC